MGISAFLLKRTLLPGCQISPAFKKTKTRTKTKKKPSGFRLPSSYCPSSFPNSFTYQKARASAPSFPVTPASPVHGNGPFTCHRELSLASQPFTRPRAECSPALPERAPPLTVTRPLHLSSFLRPPPEAPSDAQCSPGRYLVTTY